MVVPGMTVPAITDRPSFLRLGLMIALAGIIVDQASKWWIFLDIMRPPQSIPVTPFFNLVLTWNTGISFGIFNNSGSFNSWFLSLLAIAIVVFLVFWLRKADNRWLAAGLGLIIGGALGNVIDRAVHGAVVDFLDFHLSGYHWPAFNGADSFIFIGAAIIILDSLFSRRPDENRIEQDEQ